MRVLVGARRGLEVSGLDALHARLKNAGIETWSEGGIVQQGDGSRAVVVRDPDAGAFVELFENPQNRAVGDKDSRKTTMRRRRRP